MPLVVGQNTYVTQEEADNYLAYEQHGTWADATAEEKEKALVQAARIIDRQRLKGYKVLSDQPMAFPRIRDPVAVRSLISDLPPHQRPAVTATVPQRVKDAQCEQAAWLLSLTPYQKKRDKEHELGIVGGSVGDASEQSTVVAVHHRMQNTPLCAAARELLRPWLGGAVDIR